MKVRIAGLHASDKKPVVEKEVVIRGYVQVYDEKRRMWTPLRTRVWVDVDGSNYGVLYTNPDGSFEFKYVSGMVGKRRIEFRVEGCKRAIDVEFVSEEKSRRVKRIGTIAVLLLIILLVVLYIVMVIV